MNATRPGVRIKYLYGREYPILNVLNHTGDDTLESFVKKLFIPSFIGGILKDENVALKKSFGQNFLINRDIARRLLDYADLKGTDTVLEIGPGLGTLTFSLAKRVKSVIAVELDRGLARYLRNRIQEFSIPNIKIMNCDFLKMGGSDFASLGDINKVVSNLPYSIGIRALLRIVEEMGGVRSITGTVQKEIAMRLAAEPGMKEYSSVSVIMQYAADIHVPEKRIAPENFFPPPEVESAIVSLVIHAGNDTVEKEFRDVVRAGFSNRRKSLVNNLSSLEYGLSKNQLQGIVRRLFHDVHVRAEKLTVQDFRHLAEHLAYAKGPQHER